MSAPSPLRTKSRVTMAAIAAQVGVSLATVDRVLNSRGVVRAKTRDLVLQAASATGYVVAAARLPMRFVVDVVLPGGTNSFLNLLATEILAAASTIAGLDMTVRLHRVEGFDPDALASCLDTIEMSNGVGLVALDHPRVRDAIRRLGARKIPVATLVSDMGGIDSLGYVGIDNRASGRLAAQLLGRLVGPTPGCILLFLGSRSYRGHEEREIGFRHLVEDDFPALTIVAVRDMRDDNEATRRETARLLRAHEDLVGIYNIAGGNRGIAEALRDGGAANRITFVAHELTPASRPLLVSGLVDVLIDQDPAMEARVLLRLLVDGVRADRGAPIRITPFFRENLP